MTTKTTPHFAPVSRRDRAHGSGVDVVSVLVAPLDAVRSALLRALGRSGRTLFSDRALRIALYGVVGIVSALLTTCFAPVWAFALGPVLLGVPHLVADVRYLVVRPGFLRRPWLLLAVGTPLAASVFFPSTAIGLAAGLGAVACARTSLARRFVAGAAWAGVVFLSARFPAISTLALVHAHNVLAVLLFLVAFATPRRLWTSVLPAIVFVAAIAAFLLGALDPWLFRHAALADGPRTGLTASRIVASLAPLSDPVLSLRLAFLFVFAQGVHYVYWLRLVPEAARDRPGLRSFRSSLRALRADLGAPVLVLAALAMAALGLRALTSLEGARLVYLRLASPHAYLEIAFLLLWLLEREGAPSPTKTLERASRVPART